MFHCGLNAVCLCVVAQLKCFTDARVHPSFISLFNHYLSLVFPVVYPLTPLSHNSISIQFQFKELYWHGKHMFTLPKQVKYIMSKSEINNKKITVNSTLESSKRIKTFL